MAFSLTDVKNLYDQVDGFINKVPPPFARTQIDNAANNRNAVRVDDASMALKAALSNDTTTTSAAKKNSYEILHYPADLLVSDNLTTRYPHAMLFFVNVSSKSLLGSDPNNLTLLDINGQTLDLTSRTQGSSVASSFNTGALAAAPSDGGTRLVAARYRSVACVMLPIPLNVQAAYNIGYGQGGVDGLMGNLVANGASGGISGLMDVLGSDKTWGGVAKEGGKVFTGMLEGFANTSKSGKPNGFRDFFGKSQNTGGLLDKIEGTTKNPRKEQIFSGVEFRTFNFSWNIPIRSTSEWITIRKIIALFKKHMHPELESGTNGTYLVMPDEFDIQFFQKDPSSASGLSESQTLPKIATSVIEALQVNYTPQGSWVAFEGTMIPPFVQISMTTKELEPMIRSMVSDIEDVAPSVRDSLTNSGHQEQANNDNKKFRGF